MALASLTTPAFIVHLPTLVRNTRRVLEHAQRHGVRVRPHIKTHKCLEAASYQLWNELVRDRDTIHQRTAPSLEYARSAVASGITVSTLGEASFFADAGFQDILLAIPLAPRKLPLYDRIRAKIERFIVLIDSIQAADDLIQYARSHSTVWHVVLEVDCGYHRCGIEPNAAAVELATRLQLEPLIELYGIYTHGGHGYGGSTREQIDAIAAQERSVMNDFARTLRAAGVECTSVGIGSTPTLLRIDDATQPDSTIAYGLVNELHPGNYVFFDLMQYHLGSCTLEDCAGRVLATVVANHPSRNNLVIDAGALALSKDLGATHVVERALATNSTANAGPAIASKWGYVLHHASWNLLSITQELGVIQLPPNEKASDYPVDTLVQVVPHHSCLAAACFPEYTVIDESDRVIDTWRTCDRVWC